MIELHSYDTEHKLIKLSIKDFLELNIVNWKYNRPPDEVRCTEIAEYFTKFTPDILQPFVFHYLSNTQQYEALDGIHRWNSLTKMKNTQQMNEKFVLIHVYTDKSDGFLVDIFQNLNKTVPVPNLYFRANNEDETEKQIIEHITKDWMKKYQSHFSPNANCNVPNINRDIFIELITDIYKSSKIRSKEKLEEVLQCANQKIKERTESSFRDNRNKFSDKQKEKCVKTGCYLFLYRPDIIKTII
jgi:hypothetical protein